MEMRPASKKAWTKVEDTKSLELTASKLTEGTEYVFRVAAQNAVGVGEFVELQKAVVPKGQFGKSIVQLLYRRLCNTVFYIFTPRACVYPLELIDTPEQVPLVIPPRPPVNPSSDYTPTSSASCILV